MQIMMMTLLCMLVLCCAGDDTSTTTSEKHSNEQRVVGGNDALPTQRPFQCELFNKADNTVFCGCSVISQFWVLTAAHCLRKINDVASTDTDTDLNNIQIILGVVDLLSSARLTKSVTLARMHPSYTWEVLSLSRVDLAWIKLQDPLDFSTNRVQPIELASNKEPSFYPPAALGKTAQVSGWGSLGGALGHPHILQIAEVPILSNNVCNQRLNDTGRLPIISDAGICASGIGKDSCGGDSGSALTLRIDTAGGLKQIGVVSYGTGPVCGGPDDYGVYVRIGVFKDYIQEHMDEPLLAGLGIGPISSGVGSSSMLSFMLLLVLGVLVL